MEVVNLKSEDFATGEKVIKVIWNTPDGKKIYYMTKSKFDNLVSGK